MFPRCCSIFFAVLLSASVARAGWVMEVVTKTENAPELTETMTLWFGKNRVKEIHPNGNWFVWQVDEGKMIQVSPTEKTWAGGPVKQMASDVRKHLERLSAELSKLSPEELEQRRKENPNVPLPADPPETPPVWKVTKKDETREIVGHEATLHEIRKDGILWERRWIAPDVEMKGAVGWQEFEKTKRPLEAAFAEGMGRPYPEGEEIEALLDAGVQLRTEYVATAYDVVREVVKLDEKELEDADFEIPSNYTKRE